MGYTQIGLNHKHLKNNIVIIPKQNSDNDNQKVEKPIKNKTSEYDDIRKKVEEHNIVHIENKNNKSKHSESKKLLNIF
jgi:hypothetical protein